MNKPVLKGLNIKGKPQRLYGDQRTTGRIETASQRKKRKRRERKQ